MDDSSADQLWKWTVRGLYLVAIVGNLIVFYDTWKDTPAGLAWQERMRGRWARLANCQDCARRRARLRQLIHYPVIFDAEAIVDDAVRDAADQG